MKNFCLLILFFVINFGYCQSGPATPPSDDCNCCNSKWDPQKTINEDQIEYYECLNECNNSLDPEAYCNPIPIDNNILILLFLGIAIGGYKIYTIKKKATI